MNLFEKIYDISDSTESLDLYLSANFELIEDFHNTGYFAVENFKDSIEKFILLKFKIIEGLDYSKSYNKAFASILLEFSERFSLSAAALRIHSILEENKLNIGLRLQAGLLYLYNIDTNSRIVERFDDICKLLQKSIELEEDGDLKSTCTFLNYYASVLINTSIYHSELIRNKLKIAVENKIFDFLKNQIFEQILNLDINDSETCYEEIQTIIDLLLNKFVNKTVTSSKWLNKPDLIIETGTEYAELLSKCKKSFYDIRKISLNKLAIIDGKDDLFKSLGRGVSILENEGQLLQYMSSFGKMHYEKLIDSYEHLPKNLTKTNFSLIDWGCGQALATISYFDYANLNNINNVVLIEPSKIAIKRGALHVNEYCKNIKIDTINKDFDSLNDNDLNGLGSETNLHIFSNILDMDLFSLKSLIEKIESNFKGNNYFVCVSPYVTDLKTNRLDTFATHFKNNHSYKMHYKVNNRVGDWKNEWSRVIRVFEVYL